MESNKNRNEEGSKTPMTPWELQASVISIPRFDYKAPSSLLQLSYSALLITCTIKRKKSATKEAMSIFSKFVGSFNFKISGCSESSNAIADTKRRKICSEEIDQNIAYIVDSAEVTEGEGRDDKSEAPDFVLSLVKLTRSGLLLLTFPGENSLDTIDIVSDIFRDLESVSLKSPLITSDFAHFNIVPAKLMVYWLSHLASPNLNAKLMITYRKFCLQLGSTEEELKRASEDSKRCFKEF
ncbi:hypothetical protein CRYUN_Cryun21dG0035400 [Craigia yunnanensis]